MAPVLVEGTIGLLTGILWSLAILVLLAAVLIHWVMTHAIDTDVCRARAPIVAIRRSATAITLWIPVEVSAAATAMPRKLHLDAGATHAHGISAVGIAQTTTQTGQRRHAAYLVKRLIVAGHHAQIGAKRGNVE